MKSDKLKDIFDPTFQPDVEDSWHEMERIAIDESYLADALEQDITAEDLNKLEAKFDQSVSGGMGLPGVYLLSSLLVGLFGGLALLFGYWGQSNPIESDQPLLLTGKQSRSIQLAHSIDPITPENSEEHYLKPGSVDKEKVIDRVNPQVEPISQVKRKWITTIDPAVAAARKLDKIPADYQYKFLLNFKVFDYSDRENVERDYWISEGAADGSLHARKVYQKNASTKYESRLKRALFYINKREYQKALKQFRFLRLDFKRDQNVMFYSGLCYFEEGEYTYALEQWNFLLAQPQHVFREEALWLRALTLEQLNRKEQAKAALTEIASSAGFYEKRAQEKLKNFD